MKIKLTFLMVIFAILPTVAQQKKASFELNFPIDIKNGTEKQRGGLDIAFKHFFNQGEVFSVGGAYNYTYVDGLYETNDHREEWDYESPKYNRFYNFYHVNFLLGIDIPNVEKLHQFVEFGFTYFKYQYEYGRSISNGVERYYSTSEDDLGFNLKFGFQYDITDHLYLQSQFHYIRTYFSDEYDTEFFGSNTNQIKFGFGVRL